MKVELDIPENVQAFSILFRGEKAQHLSRWHCWLHREYSRDQFNRGLGDICGNGYAETRDEALSWAIANMNKNFEQRLAERNASPPGSSQPKGLVTGEAIETSKSADDLGL